MSLKLRIILVTLLFLGAMSVLLVVSVTYFVTAYMRDAAERTDKLIQNVLSFELTSPDNYKSPVNTWGDLLADNPYVSAYIVFQREEHEGNVQYSVWRSGPPSMPTPTREEEEALKRDPAFTAASEERIATVRSGEIYAPLSWEYEGIDEDGTPTTKKNDGVVALRYDSALISGPDETLLEIFHLAPSRTADKELTKIEDFCKTSGLVRSWYIVQKDLCTVVRKSEDAEFVLGDPELAEAIDTSRIIAVGNRISVPFYWVSETGSDQLLLKENFNVLRIVLVREPVPLWSWEYPKLIAWELAVGFAVYILIILLILNRYIFVPLARVMKATASVGEGDYSATIGDISATSELKQLIRTFNDMTEKLRAYSEDMEEEVAKATAKFKTAERNLIIAERINALGRVASGIAHEINNPIAGMINATRRLKDRAENEKTREYLDLILDGLNRIAETVKKILRFTPRRGEKRIVVFEEVAERARMLVDFRMKQKDIDFTFSMSFPERSIAPGTYPKVVADPAEVQQAFLNLLLNAIDAVGTGGAITVTVRPGASTVIAEFTDTGKGMTNEEIVRCFDLYYTTKPEGEGSGIGLYIVHTIMQNNDGKVEIESTPAQGTTIRLIFKAN